MKSKRAEIIKMYFDEKMRPVDIAKKRIWLKVQ